MWLKIILIFKHLKVRLGCSNKIYFQIKIYNQFGSKPTKYIKFKQKQNLLLTANDRGMGRLTGGSLMLGFGWGNKDCKENKDHFFSIFCSVFALLLIVILWLIHDSCCVCFIVPFLLSLSLFLLVRRY